MLNRGTLSYSALACFVLAGLVGLAGGCVHQPPSKAVAEAPASPSDPADAPSSLQDDRSAAAGADGAPPLFASPDALAQKAQSYSRQIESLLAERSSNAAGADARPSDPADPSASARQPVPSQVAWADPRDFRLGDVAPAPAIAADERALRFDLDRVSVQPVIETSAVEANRIASIAPLPDPLLNAAANTPARADEGVIPATHPAMSSPGSGGALPAKLAARVRDYPRDVAGHLEFQLLQLLLDEQVPQLAALASLPSEDRELITAVLDGLSLFRSTLRSDNNMLLSRKIKPLIDMADRLRSQADLTIPAVALCRSVEGFGKFEPIEPPRFAAGSEHRAIIYCEVANFASNLNHEQRWETKLKQDLVLYTEFGVPVWNDRSETILDTARNRRHDFFINKRIVLPANLTVGRYLLKVSIVDEQANRVAEATIPLVIAAK